MENEIQMRQDYRDHNFDCAAAGVLLTHARILGYALFGVGMFVLGVSEGTTGEVLAARSARNIPITEYKYVTPGNIISDRWHDRIFCGQPHPTMSATLK